ncbi:MAG: phospholipase D family protein [Vicinamibacterales bacterium]
MTKVLSIDLWKSVLGKARRSRQRKAAVAYVTKDLVGLSKGDVLVVDASVGAVKSGETDAKLLRRLKRRGVAIYNCQSLHAKVWLLDDTAVVGSANMSSSSKRALVEAAVITDNASIVAGVASFIEQLVERSPVLEDQELATLCRIRVVKRGGRGTQGRRTRRPRIAPLGNRTWLVGVQELADDPPPSEQRLIDKAIRTIGLGEEVIEWIRWTGKSRFIRDCREGDVLIQVWRSATAKHPSEVYRASEVLLKQKTAQWTRLYVRRRGGRYSALPFGQFTRLLKRLGDIRPVGRWVTREVRPELADAIQRAWTSASTRKA